MFLEAVCTLEVCLVTVRHIMVPCASFAAGGVEACDPDGVVSATLETLERSGRCWVDGGADVRQVDVFRERVPSKGEEEGAPTSVCLDYVLGGPDVGDEVSGGSQYVDASDDASDFVGLFGC